MLQNREVSIDQFLKITSGGIKIADFDQVQAAIVKRYKEAYGTDIDVTNTNADGVFIYDLSLIINNILQTFKGLYSNLNVETASGVYLDDLCRLSNVSRKQATQSVAQLKITSTQNTSLTSGTIFVDNNGTEWVYSGQDISVVANAEPIVIKVTCSEYGPIKALARSITQTLQATYLVVEQDVDAMEGMNDETDAELRARRAQSTGATGTTVEESLVGALLTIDGVRDAQIIDNNTGSSESASDTTSINSHSIYVILRIDDRIDEDSIESTIGDVIYSKLTPGIRTTKFDPVSSTYEDTGKSKEVVKSLTDNIDWLTQTIYWKQAKPIHPECSVVITKTENYANETTSLIKTAVIEYLNNLPLSKLPTQNDMLITAAYAGPTFKGQRTYFVDTVTLPDIADNPNTYFKYNIDDASEVETGDTITITFE